MIKLNFSVVFLTLALVSGKAFGAVDIGKYFKLCDRNSPDVNDCLVGAIQDGISVMANGIKELNVPPIEPYYQKELRVSYSQNQVLAKVTLKDINVYGLKAAKVKKVRLRADEDRFHLEVDIEAPLLYVDGTYLGDGSFNTLAIKTTGKLNATMKDVVCTWKLDGKPEKKGDQTHIRIHSFYMRPDVSYLGAFLTNDNPESKEITDLANQFANSNWKTLYTEMLPAAQANWSKMGIRIANKLFLKVPYDQLFPEES